MLSYLVRRMLKTCSICSGELCLTHAVNTKRALIETFNLNVAANQTLIELEFYEFSSIFRAHMIQPLYDEIISNKDDEHSKISLQAIDHMSTIFTNFAKYG